MQTEFTAEQLRDPKIAQANKILRSCVHCGMCTATCPTYQVLGNEMDSPRGRIYLIKEMLEKEQVPDAKTVMHLDRCLSCLACKTTCPSGVDYMHLIDQARAYVETRYQRPLLDRMLRRTLAYLIPRPRLFRLALFFARLGRPFRGLMPDHRLKAMMDMAPRDLPPLSPQDTPGVYPAQGARQKRVLMMTGCAQKALNTDINTATMRLLRRLGCDVVVADDTGCCGALSHHMGYEEASHARIAANVKTWWHLHQDEPIDAIVINTSGCGTTIKDYGHILASSPLAKEAQWVSDQAMDISELLIQLDLSDVKAPRPMHLAYHGACSLQHGQQVKFAPKDLLKSCGFTISEPKDSHLCCGSAGTYNLLQPEISSMLKRRKVDSIEALEPQAIVAGNLGCMMQIASGTHLPVVHLVEMIDWAHGGPCPAAIKSQQQSN